MSAGIDFGMPSLKMIVLSHLFGCVERLIDSRQKMRKKQERKIATVSYEYASLIVYLLFTSNKVQLS